jgi:hypothetical protein
VDGDVIVDGEVVSKEQNLLCYLPIRAKQEEDLIIKSIFYVVNELENRTSDKRRPQKYFYFFIFVCLDDRLSDSKLKSLLLSARRYPKNELRLKNATKEKRNVQEQKKRKKMFVPT